MLKTHYSPKVIRPLSLPFHIKIITPTIMIRGIRISGLLCKYLVSSTTIVKKSFIFINPENFEELNYTRIRIWIQCVFSTPNKRYEST